MPRANDTSPSRIEVPSCAAIKFMDGVIIAGRRHDVCIKAAVTCGRNRDDIANAIQGFMTTSGWFVDRSDAYKLAVAAGIVIDRPGSHILMSEDLY